MLQIDGDGNVSMFYSDFRDLVCVCGGSLLFRFMTTKEHKEM